ncbi:MAG: phosphoribosylformylglycinamidine synthase subunit PurQ, partial [Proteobacteria bacterium]|nr:phosphoribosylformylglycinamidine synthase subunit PurQ [Pseudomonadota bacterium]
MKAAVIVFPGSNCDRDVRVALGHSMGKPPAMVWHRETALPAVDLIVIPGGFSYGDYLRAGAMAAHSPVMAAVVERARKGVPVLGICNGFQILTETGLLPGMLMRNAGLKFVCRDVHLRVDAADTVFTRGYREGQVIRIPVAHHEGNYFADEDT